MGQSLELIILAVIAGAVLFRLYATLGTRHGEERTRSVANPLVQRPPNAADRIPTPLVGEARGRPEAASDEPAWQSVSTGSPEGLSLGEGLRRVAAADPSFQEKTFRDGAMSAWTMIVGAFYKGDVSGVQPYLAPDVYEAFQSAIAAQRSGETRSVSEVRQLKDGDLLQAWVDGPSTVVRVRFRSDQLHYQLDGAGNVVAGSRDEAVEVEDIWTFKRDTRSRDPNWLLVETDSN